VLPGRAHNEVPKDSADQSPNAKELDGRTVSITGKIVLYKGKPKIVVDTPSQIKKKDEARARAFWTERHNPPKDR